MEMGFKKLVAIFSLAALLSVSFFITTDTAYAQAPSCTVHNVSVDAFNAPFEYQGGACTQEPIFISSVTPGETLTVSNIAGSTCGRVYPRAGACVNDTTTNVCGWPKPQYMNIDAATGLVNGGTEYQPLVKIGFYNASSALISEESMNEMTTAVTVPAGAVSAYAYFRDVNAGGYMDNNGAYDATFSIAVCDGGYQPDPGCTRHSMSVNSVQVPFDSQGETCARPPVLIGAVNPGDTLTVSNIAGSTCGRIYPRIGACVDDINQTCGPPTPQYHHIDAATGLLTAHTGNPGPWFPVKIGFFTAANVLISQQAINNMTNAVTVPNGAAFAYAYYEDPEDAQQSNTHFDNNAAYDATFFVDVCDSNLTECQDGSDNDGDSLIDYPLDPGCFGGADDDEFGEPIGHVSVNSDCNNILGWSCDPDNFNQPIDVHFYDGNVYGQGGGTFLGAATADISRDQSVAAQCGGNADHGYSFAFPEFLKDGQDHEIYVYGINIGTPAINPILPQARTINCSASQIVECNDGIDNDGDGATDFPGDYSCTSTTDNDETNPMAECQDGINNDGDAFTDYPADPECGSEQDTRESTLSACSDGIDNDGDGYIDLDRDPGCYTLADPSEFNTFQCNDGIDNDGDGQVDFPADSSCRSPIDTSENRQLSECEDGVDNDGNGLIDFPLDPLCMSIRDNSESS